MEDFYRWQRQRLDVLMDDGEPAGGRWNHDSDNRERPPTDGRPWPKITRFQLDVIDHEEREVPRIERCCPGARHASE